MPLLFVYGSLKQGFRLHPHLAAGILRGMAHTGPGYALYRVSWYPGMVADETSGGVSGELYEIPEALLPVLDEVEGVPDLYRRASVTVTCPDYSGEPVQALTYVYQQPVEPRSRIESGHWAADTAPD